MGRNRGGGASGLELHLMPPAEDIKPFLKQ
jgi:hypothetical protein